MNAASFDIKDMLEAGGLGLIYKTNLWIAKEPTTPDDVVTLFDTPGFPPERTIDNENWYYRSSIQVWIRNNDYQTGMDLARNIMVSLHGRANSTWNDTLYTVITAMGEPVPLARDEDNRTIIIINFNLQRR